MKALVVVVALEALLLGVVLAVYLHRESSTTTFPSVVPVQAAALAPRSTPVGFPAPIVGRTKHVALISRGGRATAVQP